MLLKNTFGQDITKAGGSIVPTTVNSSVLAPQPLVQLPAPYTVANGPALNASVATPVQSTAAQTQQAADQPNSVNPYAELLASATSSMQDLLGSAKSPDQLKAEADAQGNVAATLKVKNSIANKLQGLMDQGELLRLQAAPGGTIDNTMQQNAEGRGITTGGLAPLTAAELRKNQIAQNANAAEALTVKSAYFAASNDYAAAADAADKAARLAFDTQEQQLKYKMQAQENAKFLFSAAEKKIADENSRKWQIELRDYEFAREDAKVGQALIANTQALYGNDPTAQFAAQQALNIPLTDPNYLTKVRGLIGRFQQNPLEIEQLQNTLTKQRLEIKKLDQEIKNADVTTPITNINATKYAGALSVILGSAKLTKDQKNSLIQSVNAGEDPVAVLKNQAKSTMTGANQTKVESYETAQYALQQVASQLDQYYAAGGKTDIFKGNFEKVVNKLGTVNDPKLVELATQIQQSLQIYRNAVSGTAYSVQEGNDIASIFPGIQKGQLLNNSIVAGRMKAFDDGIDGAYRGVLGSTYDALKTTKQPSTGTVTQNGRSFEVGKVYEDASKQRWTVDASGKWTKL